VSPRAADPEVRSALIEAGAKLLAEHGPAALTTRALARAVGASTTAVYTHFGSMGELRRAIRHEGFARFRAYLDAVPVGDEPLTELIELGQAYMRNAFENPDLYRVMFMEAPLDEEDWATGLDTFQRLVDATQRAIDRGLYPGLSDAYFGAQQCWTTGHGVVSLVLTGMITQAEAERLSGEIWIALYERFATRR
jgi:AcrR family transcriptional regulator